MKTKILFILTLLFFANQVNVFAQSPDVVAAFESKFPNLKENSKKTLLSGDLDDAKSASLREEFKRLQAAIDDMNAFKISPKDPILSIFEKKELKGTFKKAPNESADEMVALITKNMAEIRDYMADKAQYGMDPQTSQRNISLFSEFKKQEHYEDAYIPWTYTFLYSPRAHKVIYTTGESILKALIEKETNATRRENLIDTLLIMFDQRIKYFGEEGAVLGRKGVNLLKYRNSSFVEAYGMLKKSVEMEKENSLESVILTYMQTTSEIFKRDMKNASGKPVVEADAVISAYNLSIELLEKKKAVAQSEEDKSNINLALQGVEVHFSNSGAANCDALLAIYQPKFNEGNNKMDTIFLAKTLKVLDQANCDDSDLHFEISKQLHQLKPSPLSANSMAKRYFRKKEFTTAAEYYKEALTMCVRDEMKAQMNYELALCYKEMDNYSQSRNYARDAIALDKNYGKAYLLIGILYASSASSCGKDDFEKSAVYWAAVDKFIQAKSVDPSIAEEADKLIGAYSARFPNKENAFMYSITAGSNYTVGCWIQEVTKARF